MKLIHHRLLNYKGLKAFELKPGEISIITGGNGKGKTTVLDSFRSLAEGGKEPDSIHAGEEEAEIKSVWSIEEGDPGGYEPGRYEILRKIKPDGYSLSVKGPKGKPIPKEGTFVKTFLAPRAFDPLAFDLLTDEERADAMKTILRVPVKTKDIRAAASLIDLGVIKEEKFDDGVAAVENFIAAQKLKAADLRAAIADRKGSINTFRASIEGNSAEDVAADLATATANIKRINEAIAEMEGGLQKTKNDAIAEAMRIAAAEHSATNDWERTEIDRIRKEAAEKRKATDEVCSKAKDDATDTFVKATSEELPVLQQQLADATATAKGLHEKQQKAAELKGAQDQLEKWEKETADKTDELESITVAVKGLDGLKHKLLKSLPLDGFQIKNRKLYIGEVLSSEANTATRYMAWFELAGLEAKDGGFVICDGLEALEPANREIVEEAIKNSGIQFIGALRSEGPLRVENSLKDLASS